MRVLVIGGGGREHALAWKLKQSPRVNKVFVAPGNAGTALEEGLQNIPIASISDLIEFANNELVEVTIVGPEALLAEGIVDAFRLAGLKIFGPTKQAIQLEASKDYSKDFMRRHSIPTAAYATFCDPAKAHKYLDKIGAPIVIKADGLAAGKGVKVAMTLPEAHETVDAMLVSNSMGGAGEKILIEEFLEGEEVSFIVMADGNHVLPLATSQDYKRLEEGNQGPNTGGMGAYSPAPIVTPELHARIINEVIDPVIRGMAEEGQFYTGFLYAGLMIGKGESINVLEYNCRMGDPETQPIMLRLKSDLSVLVENAIDGTLNNVDAEWDHISPEMLRLAEDKSIYRALYIADLIGSLDAFPNDYGAVVSAGTFTHGHLGSDALMNILTMGRPGSLYVIGINKVHFDALKFGELIEELISDTKISHMELREIPMYSKTDHEHGADVALALIFRKSR